MSSLEKLQRISKWLRYLVIFISLVIVCAILIVQVVYDHMIVGFANENLNTLWGNPEKHSPALYFLTAPTSFFAIFGVYWLQRLFGEYQKGEFFTANNMKCYLWLIWLKAGQILYTLILPFILPYLPNGPTFEKVSVAINISAIFTWLLLVCIVYVLKMAHEINNENKEFI